jgi:drug/metabolite transporter (DMT)-like permease
VDARLALGIFVGALALTFLNLGKGIQKLKVHVLTQGRAMFRPPHRRDFRIWLGGILLTSSSSILLSVALMITDKSSIVSAMAGVGLVALIVFSHFVLHERIGAIEIAGSALIIVGTASMGLADSGDAAGQVYRAAGFFRGVASLVLGFAVLVAYTRLTGKRHGLIYGALAGACAGTALILADVALARAGNGLIAQFGTVQVYLAIVIGMAAMAITQYAFLHGRAVEAVPAFNSLYILTPAGMEILTFGTSVSPLQWAGMGLIVGGVIVLSATKERELK